MTTTGALALVLVVLIGIQVWERRGPRRAQLVTGPVAALVLLLIGRMAGLTWDQLGLSRADVAHGALYGAVLAAGVAVVYVLLVAIPATRVAFRDTRYQVGTGPALRAAVVTIPLSTVVVEECAFRGVLWGLLARDAGVMTATVVSSLLFGFWHVLPAVDLACSNSVLRGERTAVRSRVLLTVLATVVFTAVAGILFAELRRRTGSLLAPIGVHWAVNGMGVLAAARVWAISSR